MNLTASQQAAKEKILNFIQDKGKKVFILKGPAGTGKTTLIRELLTELRHADYSIKILASTGRAAKILRDKIIDLIPEESDTTVLPSVKTIHSEIYTFEEINQELSLFAAPTTEKSPEKDIKLNFKLSTPDYCEAPRLYFIDEASMIGDLASKGFSQASFGEEGRLLKDLLRYDNNAKFVFIGDACQLPPVGQIESPALDPSYFSNTFHIDAEEAELVEIMRQKNDVDIIDSATIIRKRFLSPPPLHCAKFPFRGYRDIHLLPSEGACIQEYEKNILKNGYDAATLITLSNRKSSEISSSVRRFLGFGHSTLSEGELLLVTQNNLITGLTNGDLVIVRQIGRREKRASLTFINIEVESLSTHQVFSQLLIEDILYSPSTNLSPAQQNNLMIDFFIRMRNQSIRQNSPQFKDCMMRDSYLNALRCVFGYSLTCHKAQGGEWNSVYLIIPRGLPYSTNHADAYRWVYTAMTRAKQNLFVVNDYWIQ